MANIIEYAINVVDNSRSANASARAEMDKTKAAAQNTTAAAGKSFSGLMQTARAGLMGLTRAIAVAAGYVTLIIGAFKAGQFIRSTIQEWVTGARAFEKAMNVVRERLLDIKDYVAAFGKSEAEMHDIATERMEKRIKKIGELQAAYAEGLTGRIAQTEAQGENSKVGKTPEQQAMIDAETRIKTAGMSVEGARNALESTTSMSGQRTARYNDLMSQRATAETSVARAGQELLAYGNTPMRDQKYTDLMKAEEALKQINTALETLNYDAVIEEKKIASSSRNLETSIANQQTAEKEKAQLEKEKYRLEHSSSLEDLERVKKETEQKRQDALKLEKLELTKAKAAADARMQSAESALQTPPTSAKQRAAGMIDPAATMPLSPDDNADRAMAEYLDPELRKANKAADKAVKKVEARIKRDAARGRDKLARTKRGLLSGSPNEGELAAMGVEDARAAAGQAQVNYAKAADAVLEIQKKFDAYIEKSTLGGN